MCVEDYLFEEPQDQGQPVHKHMLKGKCCTATTPNSDSKCCEQEGNRSQTAAKLGCLFCKVSPVPTFGGTSVPLVHNR